MMRAALFACAFTTAVAVTSCAGDSDDGDEGEGEGEGGARAALCLDVDEHDFGTVVVGDSSEPATFTLTNCGSAESGFIAVQAAGNFVVNAFDCGRVAVGASCSVRVTFEPNTTGPLTGSITLTDDGDVVGDEVLVATVALRGTGAAGAQFSFAPSFVDFGSVLVGASTSRAVQVTNEGDIAGDTLGVIGGVDAGAFSVVGSTCSGSLVPGGACSVEIAFSAQLAGAKSGTFTVGEDAVPLSGLALADAELVMSPTSRNFGAVGLGQSSAALAFTVTNFGDVDSGVLSELVEGGDAAEFVVTASGCAGAVLAPNTSCVVSVTFSPAGIDGNRSATLRVAGAPGGSVNASLSGTAVTSDGIVCNPSALDFGDVVVGNGSDELTCTVSNEGGAETGTLATFIAGADAASFAVTFDTCDGETLFPGEACVVSLQFVPSAVAAASATLSVSTDGGGITSVALTGNGILGAVLEADRTGIDFGSEGSGGQSAPVDIVVTNAGDLPTGDAPLVTLGGPSLSQFELVASTCVAVLAPSDSCTVTVRYVPTFEGTHDATVTISADGAAPALVQLTGTGVTADFLNFSSGGGGFDFGAVAIGDQSAQVHTVTVTNLNDDATGTISLTLIGANASSFAIISDDCDVLVGNESCDVTIAFAPQTPPGNKVAQLQVSAVPGGVIVTGDLIGNATP